MCDCRQPLALSGCIGTFCATVCATTAAINLAIPSENFFSDTWGMISPASLKLSLTRRSLGRFAQVVMPAFEVDPFHQLMVSYLEDLLSGKIKKLAIICPPRHGKTTLGNIIAPAYALGRNPTETVITVSYGS
jgi:hypothetical protein